MTVGNAPAQRDVEPRVAFGSRRGAAIAWFVVKKAPDSTAEPVLEHCRRHLTSYELPKHTRFRDRLPKTAIGKNLRRSLGREFASPHG